MRHYEVIRYINHTEHISTKLRKPGGKTVEEASPLRGKYFSLFEQYPQIELRISALDRLQMNAKRDGVGLSHYNLEALLLFSLWAEDPVEAIEVAEKIGISERELNDCVDISTYDLEIHVGHFFTIVDSLELKASYTAKPANISVPEIYPPGPAQNVSGQTIYSAGEHDREIIPQTYNHPILTREQEYIAFDFLKRGASLKQLMESQEFVSTIPSADKARFETVCAQSRTIEDFLCGCNFRLVNAMARAHRYRDVDLTLKDRINAGNIGLLHAVREFDHMLGYKLSTYAVWKIRAEIDKAVREESAIRISRGTQEDLGKLRWILGAFQAIFGCEPTREELRQQLIANTDLSKSRIDNALEVFYRKLQRIVSIHEEVSLNNEDERADFIPDKNADVENIVFQRSADDETKIEVRRALDENLTEEERRVIKSIFGIDVAEKTLDEVATETGRHRYEIDAIRQRSLVKLRRDLRLREAWEKGEVPTFIYHVSAEEAAFRLGLFTDPFDTLTQEGEETTVERRHGILFVPPAGKEPEANVVEKTIFETEDERRDLANDTKQAIIESLTDRQREVLELLREGLSHSEITEKLGIGSSTISLHMRKILKVVKEIAPETVVTRTTILKIFKSGDKPENLPDKENDPMEAMTSRQREILELLNEGLNQSEVARRFGLTRQAVSLHVKKLTELGILEEEDFPVRTNEYLEALSLQVKELREKGLSYSEIAEKVGLTAGAVGRRVRKLIEKRELEPSKIITDEDFKAAAKSEETEAVRRYIEDHPRFSYTDTISLIFKGRE